MVPPPLFFKLKKCHLYDSKLVRLCLGSLTGSWSSLNECVEPNLGNPRIQFIPSWVSGTPRVDQAVTG